MTPFEAFTRARKLERYIETHVYHKRCASTRYNPEDDSDLQDYLETYRECLRILVAP